MRGVPGVGGGVGYHLRVSVRLCVKCGYDLSGLPQEGTVVTCPECKLATDLSIPLQRRENPFMPVLSATIAMPLFAVGILFVPLLGAVSNFGAGLILVLSLLCGAVIAGIAMYRMIGREPGRGWPKRTHRARVVLSVCAGAVSIALNTLILFCLCRSLPSI